MAELRSIKYWLALQQAFGVGSNQVNSAMELADTAIDFFRGGEKLWSQVEGITFQEIQRLHRPDIAGIEEMLSACENLGCRIVTPEDREYPNHLRNIYAMPAALFILGDLQALNDAPYSIAMVGTRNCSSSGLRTAWTIARGLAEAGAVVVSGLALGIDSSCHMGAIAGKGRTVAVMPCGLETISPPENEFLWHHILQNGGAVVSEWPPYTSVDRKTSFRTRNRLISGMAQGVVLVEGRERSGTSITFHHGLEQGRDIFVVPWDISTSAGKWAVELLRQGAVPVACAQHILEDYEKPAMRFPQPRPAKRTAAAKEPLEAFPASQTPQEELGELEQRLLPHLNAGGAYPEQLAQASGLEIGELMQALTGLEVGGWAYAMPGGRYAGKGKLI